jgi:hypothetical protein
LFANRFTAFLDACSLASALKRNLLLSLAEAEFFRLRWSTRVLDETEAAIEEILRGKGFDDATARAKQARASMEAAFEDAMVTDVDNFLPVAAGVPDPADHHVVAAAAKTQAAMIVTENLKDFPATVLSDLRNPPTLSLQIPSHLTMRALLQPFGVCANVSRNRK